MQLLLALGFGQNRGERTQNGAHVLQRFGFRGFLLRALDRQPGDLHAFDFQRAALQRRGGVEIFVNFAGGTRQRWRIARTVDSTKFTERELRIVVVKRFAKLADRLIKRWRTL
ncbi:hypothetical protein D3C85_1286520 [compost metagenome]